MNRISSGSNVNRQVAILCIAVTSIVAAGALAAESTSEKQSGGATSSSNALPDLPEPVASFGAAVCDNWLYVYSGHIGGEHEHSRDNLSQRFSRLNLVQPQGWENLPKGPGLQSVALVADRGFVYRVGGLSARNAATDEEDLLSLDEFSRFDPKSNSWELCRPLPEGRSSHDAVVVDGILYVIGGWRLASGKQVWHDTAYKILLGDPAAKWIELPVQPFRRRALAVAAHNGKVYAIGGMGDDSKPSNAVHVFDIKTQQWSQGPALPGSARDAFGCSSSSLPSGLYVTAMDGRVLTLDSTGQQWREVGTLAEPRFFHRLVAENETGLLALGGASRKGHIPSVERFLPAR